MYSADATVRIAADQQQAWAYVSNYQNFDKFMSNIESVTLESSKQGTGEYSTWKMRGPLGIPVSWKAVTTSMEAPSYLAWKSTEGSLETTGYIRVLPEANGSSVTVHVEYNPPLGAIGEAVAKIFGDPQKQLEDDLSKLGGLIQDAPSVAQGLGNNRSGAVDVSSAVGAAGTTAAGTSTDYGLTGNVDSTVQKAENMSGGMADTGEMLTEDGKTLEQKMGDAVSRAVIPGMPMTGITERAGEHGPYDTDAPKTNTNQDRAEEVRRGNL